MIVEGAGGVERFFHKIQGHSLDDPWNVAELARLAASFQPALLVHAAGNAPELIAGLNVQPRELVVHAQWVERLEGALRTIVMTNSGQATCVQPYTITACQIVAVVLPEATVPHVLAPVLIHPALGIRLPHVALVGGINPSTMLMSADRLWTSGGYAQFTFRGSHGYRFVGCVDGILYAMKMAAVFERQRAMAAYEELLVLARKPWQPPVPEAAAVAASAQGAETARLMTRNTLAALGAVAAVIMATLVLDLLKSLFAP